MFHAGGQLHIAVSDLNYSAAADVPATVAFCFELQGRRDARPQASAIAFVVDQEGVRTQYAGDGAAWSVQPLSSAFQAAVTLGEGAWNVELRISENLLAGWNHVVGLAIIHDFKGGDRSLRTWPPKAADFRPESWATAALGPLPAAPNLPPVAVTAEPAHVAAATTMTVALDGAASYDPEGAPLRFAWRQVDGPAVALSATNRATATFTASPVTNETTLRFQLIVSDGDQTSVPAEAAITLLPTSVSPQPPPPRLTLVSSSANADAHVTPSPEGGALSIVSGPNEIGRAHV